MSINAEAYSQYKKSTVETVSPEKLLIMLYNGAIKNINNAKKAINEKDINRAHSEIMRAEEIIVELMSTLNMDYAISAKLFALYEYFYYQLTQANAKKDIALLNEVEGFLLELRETWLEAIKSIKSSQAADNPDVAGMVKNAAANNAAPAAPVSPAAAAAPVVSQNPAAKLPPAAGNLSTGGINIRG